MGQRAISVATNFGTKIAINVLLREITRMWLLITEDSCGHPIQRRHFWLQGSNRRFHGNQILVNQVKLKMSANAQRYGRPAEYRWRPLFTAAKFCWRPLLDYSAVMLPRRKSRWNLQECPKLAMRSQPLVGQSSPYCEDMWGSYWCLKSFFSIVDTCPSCKDIVRQSCAMVPRWRFFASFLRPAFPASHVQQVWDMHSKLAIRPHTMCAKYGRHPIFNCCD